MLPSVQLRVGPGIQVSAVDLDWTKLFERDTYMQTMMKPSTSAITPYPPPLISPSHVPGGLRRNQPLVAV